jgi:hypothetical protein
MIYRVLCRDLRTVGTSGEYFHRLFRPIKGELKLRPNLLLYLGPFLSH